MDGSYFPFTCRIVVWKLLLSFVLILMFGITDFRKRLGLINVTLAWEMSLLLYGTKIFHFAVSLSFVDQRRRQNVV